MAEVILKKSNMEDKKGKGLNHSHMVTMILVNFMTLIKIIEFVLNQQ